MAYWLWLDKVPGPPANNGWFALKSVAWSRDMLRSGAGTGKAPLMGEFYGIVPLDANATEIYRKYTSGRGIESGVVFIGPHTEFHFSKCTVAAANSVRENDDVLLSFSITFESSSVKNNGGP